MFTDRKILHLPLRRTQPLHPVPTAIDLPRQIVSVTRSTEANVDQFSGADCSSVGYCGFNFFIAHECALRLARDALLRSVDARGTKRIGGQVRPEFLSQLLSRHQSPTESRTDQCASVGLESYPGHSHEWNGGRLGLHRLRARNSGRSRLLRGALLNWDFHRMGLRWCWRSLAVTIFKFGMLHRGNSGRRYVDIRLGSPSLPSHKTAPG